MDDRVSNDRLSGLIAVGGYALNNIWPAELKSFLFELRDRRAADKAKDEELPYSSTDYDPEDDEYANTHPEECLPKWARRMQEMHAELSCPWDSTAYECAWFDDDADCWHRFFADTPQEGVAKAWKAWKAWKAIEPEPPSEWTTHSVAMWAFEQRLYEATIRSKKA